MRKIEAFWALAFEVLLIKEFEANFGIMLNLGVGIHDLAPMSPFLKHPYARNYSFEFLLFCLLEKIVVLSSSSM